MVLGRHEQPMMKLLVAAVSEQAAQRHHQQHLWNPSTMLTMHLPLPTANMESRVNDFSLSRAMIGSAATRWTTLNSPFPLCVHLAFSPLLLLLHTRSPRHNAELATTAHANPVRIRAALDSLAQPPGLAALVPPDIADNSSKALGKAEITAGPRPPCCRCCGVVRPHRLDGMGRVPRLFPPLAV